MFSKVNINIEFTTEVQHFAVTILLGFGTCFLPHSIFRITL